jgi:peptidoglycan glycosyltransferase
VNPAIRRVGLILLALFIAIAAQLTYLQVVRGDDLANDSRNARKFLREISRPRGPILTADNVTVARSVASDDEYKFQRVYPPDTAGLFAHVVGYQSIQFGSTGVENSYSGDLSGRTFTLNINNLEDVFANRQIVGTVVLTLSKQIQQAAAGALGDHPGSVVALDIKTGAVLAMYSNPTFDPNPLVSHDTAEAQRAFALDQLNPGKPLLPRAWREIFPPGSTFKTVTAAIAQDTNTDVDKVFPDVRFIPLPQTTAILRNFGDEQCGGTMEESFIVSCNTTFGQIGLDLGEKFATGIKNFGVQTDPPRQSGSGIDPPIVKSLGPPEGSFQQNQPAFAQAAIGQNATAVTPLQMAMVAESVATGGTILQPHVVDCVLDPNGDPVKKVPVQEYKQAMTAATAETMRTFMLGVVNDPNGTGSAARIPGVLVAGKTGTAQTGEGQRNHAWFITFAPADQPRYAVAVLVEHGGANTEATGGRVAAPIARQVLEALLASQLPPSRCGSGQP